MQDQSIAIVTGASSGIGAATAHRLSSRGFHVLAGVRKQQDADRLTADRIEPVILDITEPDHIANVVDRVETDPRRRRLGVLINNAGVGLNAPLELVPMHDWRENFEINLFGPAALTAALTPALVAANGSRVVNVSSMAGELAGPAFGPYAAAKRGLEAYSDMLRRELAPSKVAVIVVQPSSVRTPGMADGAAAIGRYTAGMNAEQHARYDRIVEATVRTLERLAGGGVEPAAAAKIIVDAVERRNPRPRYRIGTDAKVSHAMLRVLGDRTMDRVIARLLGLS